MAPLDGAMIHDITGPLAIQKFYEMGGRKVFDPKRVIMLFDHQIPADSIEAASNHVYMRKFAAEQDIHNYDINEGVCHQVTIEKGRAAPGEIVVGADSHTCMYGAAGAFATGIGSTDMGFVLKFGALYFKVPETIRAEVSGKFQKRVGAKDLILSIAADIGADGATYKAIEFTGKDRAETRHGRPDDALQHGNRDGRQGRDRCAGQGYVGVHERPAEDETIRTRQR